MTHTSLDPIRSHQREAVAKRRRSQDNMQCTCGETRVQALVPDKSLCAACKRTMKKHSTLDKHHVAGRRNSRVTVKIPVNDHRAVLNEAQRDWPKATLENPDMCPLLIAAACIRGFIDTVVYLIDQLLRWTAEMLELLSAFFTEKFGKQWWVNTPLAQFTRKA